MKQSATTKAALPDKLLIHQRDDKILVDDCQPRAGEWVATIHDDAICAEMVLRWNSHEQLWRLDAYATHFRTCSTWEHPDCTCDCGLAAILAQLERPA